MPKKHQEPVSPEVLEPEFWARTPPPDHEDFLAIQAVGLRQMKESLARRRRQVAPPSPGETGDREHLEPSLSETFDSPSPEHLDQIPPPDHEDFLALRARSFRALKKNLASRRKRREASTEGGRDAGSR